MESVFAGQQGARLAGALLGGIILPVLALGFAFPNGEYLAGMWVSLAGLATASIGWAGWRANRDAHRRDLAHRRRR